MMAAYSKEEGDPDLEAMSDVPSPVASQRIEFYAMRD
jgi:hypothetical protein